MSKSSFYSGTGLTNNNQNAIDGAKNAAEAARDAAQAAQTAAETAKTSSETAAASTSTNVSTATTKASEASNSANTASTKAQESAASAATATTKAQEASASAATATTKAQEASASATTATTKASEASASVNSVASDAADAAASATTATTKASEAAASALTASNHASTSSTKASEASTSATTATTKAQEASASSATATTKASEASTSSATATTKASEASSSASTASTKASEAAASAVTAASEASDAATSSGTATTKASEAAASAVTASGHASTATTKASEASASSATATTKASEASSSAATATTQATNAASSASTATTKASEASSSATTASAAQTAAEGARDSALAAFDSFDDRYLGVFSTAPTADNDGDSLAAGMLFFDSTASAMKVYTGSAWVAAYISGSDYLPLTGGTLTGAITFASTQTFDGRDVSAMGSKLDAIEASADVTDAANVNPLVDSHLNTSTASSGEYLSWNGSDYDWASVPAGYANSDVDTHLNTSSASSGQYLNWNGSDYAWSSVAAGYVDSDVDTHLNTSGASTNQYLKWNGSDYAWSTVDLSNVDAVTVDGLDSTQFLRSDANDTATGELTFNAKLDIANGTYIGWGGGTSRPSITGNKTSNLMQFYTGGAERLEINNSGIDVTGTVTADALTVSGDIDVGAQTGTWVTSDQMSDSIGWNGNHGVYIGSDTTGSSTYIYGSGKYYDGSTVQTLWHSGNDGSGSGLDADTVDGAHLSALVEQLSDASSPNYFASSSRRVDPNSSNPTNEHYAITTFGNEGNVTGQLATHFQTGEAFSRGYNSTWSSWRKQWDSLNDGSGSGLDADLLDGQQGSYYIDTSGTNQTKTGAFNTNSYLSAVQGVYSSNWFRAYGEEGLYSQDYGQHFYPDSGGFYWDSDGPIRIRDGHEGTIKGYLGYHDGNGFGLLSGGGSYWLNTPSSEKHLAIGGSAAYNPYDGVTGVRLMFGSADTNAIGNYYIGTNLENYGGNYNKLDIDYTTGIRIKARTIYGGTRFYDSLNDSLLLSVGSGNSDVAVANNLTVGGSLTVNGVAVGGGGGGSNFDATASGAIANGDPCCVNQDGTVSAIAQSTTSQASTTPAVIAAESTDYPHIAYGNGKVVAVFRDSNGYFSAIVGESNGSGGVSWGTKTTLVSYSAYYPRIAYVASVDKFFVLFRNSSQSNRMWYGSITVSGTTPTWSLGSWDNANVSYMDICACPEDDSVFVVGKNNNWCRGWIGRIAADGTVSLGSMTTIDSQTIYRPSCVWDSSVERVIVAFRTYYVSVAVLQITGTYTFSNLNTSSWSQSGPEGGSYDNIPMASDNKGNLVVCVDKYSPTDTKIVQAVLGSSGITWSSEQLVHTNEAYDAELTYDSNADVFHLYYEIASSDAFSATYTIGTSSLTAGSVQTIEANSTFNPFKAAGVYFPDIFRSVFVAPDNRDSNKLNGWTFNGAFSSSNLLADNYIGISNAAYSNGATATIQIVGSVDDAQSGLTPAKKYYVQKDGSLSQTADTPSVVAGTAVAATKLIVKG